MPRQCAIGHSANEGERSLGGRHRGCEEANSVDARYAKLINESKESGFAPRNQNLSWLRQRLAMTYHPPFFTRRLFSTFPKILGRTCYYRAGTGE